MKNLKKIAELVFIMMLLVFTAFSQTNPTDSSNQKKTTDNISSVNIKPNYVDNNNDGICDNRTNNGNNQFKGRNFIDVNKDGICDHRQNNERKGNCCNYKGKKCCGNGCFYGKGNGNGYQHRHGWRN